MTEAKKSCREATKCILGKLMGGLCTGALCKCVSVQVCILCKCASVHGVCNFSPQCATFLHSVRLFFSVCGNVHILFSVCGNVHTTVALTQKAAQYSVAASAGASPFMLRVHVNLFAKKQFFSTSDFL